MTRDRSASILQTKQQWQAVDREIALDALKHPERSPHLQEWARLVLAKAAQVKRGEQVSMFREEEKAS